MKKSANGQIQSKFTLLMIMMVIIVMIRVRILLRMQYYES